MAFFKNRVFLVTSATALVMYPLWNGAIHPVYNNATLREDRTAIVTGASGNLGRALTLQLAKRKVRVIMACRDMEKCKLVRREIALLTGHKGLACRQLDLEDIDSINKFADEMIKTEPHIDILINNAAVKYLNEKEITKYGIEKNYFVNFLAPFLLTFRLLDKLKESSAITRDSRVINVIGSPHKSWKIDLDDLNFVERKYDGLDAYRQSKLALAHFTILFNNLMIEKRNNIFVYGTSPYASVISRALERPASSYERLRSTVNSYYTSSADRNVSPTVKCAIDPKIGDQFNSGRLYKSLFYSSGWGKAGEDENQAKQVWNSALKLLLDIPDKLSIANSEKKEPSTDKESKIAEAGATKDKAQQKEP